MINFMKFNWLYFGLSGALVLAAILSLAVWRLNPAIDFVGGSLLEIRLPEVENVSNQEIRASIEEVEGLEVNSVAYSDTTQSYTVRTNTINEEKKVEVLDKLNSQYSSVQEDRFETVGPTLGRELMIKTLVAIVIAAILIMGYVAYQFKDRIYGLAAILAMFHDTLILVGSFSVFGYFFGVEVDTLFVTAVLTTLSFSVHDTIVVFDRIRETLKVSSSAKFVDVVNKAITETLPRSLNNSMTIIFMLTALAFLGGETIRWFIVALLIGTVLGTYSSPFVATPLLLILMRKTKK